MTFILIILIGAILSGIVSLFFSSEMLVGLYDVVFNSGITMQTITGVEFFGLIMPISYGVGISLIILKFLKKAFDIYVLWTDGDPDADPFLLLMNFVRAGCRNCADIPMALRIVCRYIPRYYEYHH